MISCRVCGQPTELLLETGLDTALISSAIPISGTTVIDVCRSCGHTQTRPVLDLETYYATQYQFRISSDDEDDLYDRVDGKNVYRSIHQARTVERKLPLTDGLRVCDYGCGKGQSLRQLVQGHPGIVPYVFDVSDAYRPFWDKFVPRAQQASFSLPPDWRGSMDLVLSLFALEHVDDPHGFMQALRHLLKPGGKLHLIVPNMIRNVSDMVVVDHVNHFSRHSLEVLFVNEGFEIDEIDEDIYRGAFVVTATCAGSGREGLLESDLDHEPRRIAHVWRSIVERVRETEASRPAGETAVIYGSGIYGLFIASALKERDRITCFLDQNDFRHGMKFFDIPVRPPDQIPHNVGMIYVALNPSVARRAIKEVPSLRERDSEFFFL